MAKFQSFPKNPTDAYALSKCEAELQADAMVRWFPFMSIASMRIHEVAPLKQVQEEHEKDPEEAKRNLWGWVSPQAVARACLASVEGDKFQGHEGERLTVLQCMCLVLLTVLNLCRM